MRPPCGLPDPNAASRLLSGTIAFIVFSTMSSAYSAGGLTANASLVLTKDFCAVTAKNREAIVCDMNSMWAKPYAPPSRRV
jgi:hypothetical protein